MSAGASTDWRTRALQDLVYERVRLHVDLLSLIELEQDLGDSLERALGKDGGDELDSAAMSRQLLDEVWDRLETEWRALREAECPLCAALDGDPARLA